jgi:hypothetical protein
LPAPIPEPKSVVPVAAVSVSILPPTTMVDTSAPSSNKLLALPEAIPPPPVATESIALAPATRPAVASPGAAIKEPPAAARAPARSPVSSVADDEVLADAGDADAQLRMAERYAAGRSGFPSHLLAYTYYQLAFLGGKQEAAAKARDERQRLQPPEIKQADALIENFRKKLSGAAGSK